MPGADLFALRDGSKDRTIYSLIREDSPEAPAERFLEYLKDAIPPAKA